MLLSVYSYETEYICGEFIYTYRLCREDGIWLNKIYNDKLKGISLEGKALEVYGELKKSKEIIRKPKAESLKHFTIKDIDRINFCNEKIKKYYIFL